MPLLLSFLFTFCLQANAASSQLWVSDDPISQILLNWKLTGKLSAGEKRALDRASVENIFDSTPVPENPRTTESKEFQELKKVCIEALTKSVYNVGRTQYKNRIQKKLTYKGNSLEKQLAKNPQRLDLSFLELTDRELIEAAKAGKFKGVTQFILEHNMQLTSKGVVDFIKLMGPQLKMMDLSVTPLDDTVIEAILKHAPNLEVLDLGFGVSMDAIKKLNQLAELRILNIRHERYHYNDLLEFIQNPPAKLQVLVYAFQENGLGTSLQNLRIANLRNEAEKHKRNTDSGHLELSAEMKYDMIEFIHPKHIYDGDTGRFNIYEGLPPGLSEIFDIRTYGIDTGEKAAVSGKSKEEAAYEYMAAIAARNIAIFTYLTYSEGITFIGPIKGKYFRAVPSIYIWIDDGKGNVFPRSLADILIANNMAYYYFGETKRRVDYKELWNENKTEFSKWINMDWQPVVEDYKRRLGLKQRHMEKVLKAAEEMEKSNRQIAQEIGIDLPI